MRKVLLLSTWMVFCLCRTTVASVQDDRGETAQHHLRSRHLPGEEEGRKQGQTNDDGNWQAPEPYPSLSDYNPHGQPPVPLSPDPLVSYTWSPATTNASHLQSYRLTQSRHEFIHRKIWPKSAVTVLENGSIQIHDTVTIQWDWGVERAAWFEVMVQLQQLQDFDERDWKMEMALSEFNSVYPGKRRVPQQYPNTTTASRSSTYRLETNDELYEGVRFTWLFVTAKTKSKSMFVQGYDDSTTTQPLLLTLKDASIVSKIKPISYTGKFASSCPRLAQIWKPHNSIPSWSNVGIEWPFKAMVIQPWPQPCWHLVDNSHHQPLLGIPVVVMVMPCMIWFGINCG